MISYHLRPCLLKLAGNFVKYLTWGTISDPLPTKILVCPKIFLRAHQNVFYIVNLWVKTFHLSYQPNLYDLLPLILLIVDSTQKKSIFVFFFLCPRKLFISLYCIHVIQFLIQFFFQFWKPVFEVTKKVSHLKYV